MNRYDVRCYYVGTGQIQKADGLVEVAAANGEEAIIAAKAAIAREGHFKGMVFSRATVKLLKKGKK